MRRTRFTQEQIIAVLKEAEAGAKIADMAGWHGVSEATIFNWKSKCGGLEVVGRDRCGVVLYQRVMREQLSALA